MREIRKLNKTQLRDALTIAAKAYPMMQISTEQQMVDFETRILEDFNQGSREWYGLFEDDKLLGSMVLHDFTMNYFGKEIKARGIGFVAVEFLHKKQKVCKDMLHWYLETSCKQKYPLAILYAFRPDFYKKMGFGHGTMCYSYTTSPERLPHAAAELPMAYLSPADKVDVYAFYETLYRQQHGMLPRSAKDIEAMLKANGVSFAGYRENGKLSAFIAFRLKSDESTNHATHMKLEMLHTSSTGLKAALNFLNSQSDQVTQIEFSTLKPDFFYNFADIRHLDHKSLREPAFHHTCDAGMGMMYRSLNPVELVLNRPCTLDNMRIRFCLTDAFAVGCKQDFVVVWKDGKAALSKGSKHDLCLKLDVSDFSSWVLNAVELGTLHSYGLLEVSDEADITDLDRAFYYQQKPICLERF